MSKTIALGSLPEPDRRAVIAEGLRIARSLEDSVLLLNLAIAQFEEIENQTKEFRVALSLLRSITPQIDCCVEETRHSWKRLEKM
ncbi:hypothetical protein AB3R30_26185 [Leptolyngbyaceae cyanobacterium UHCC 1019]